MSARSHLVCLTSALLLAGAALAQEPPNPGQNPPPTGQTTNPSTGAPASPGANPSAYPYPGAGPVDTGTEMRMSDKAFLKKAAEGNMTEVELGKLAEEKGSNQAVRDFGKRMVDDHTKANQELSSTAARINVQVPSELPHGAKKNVDKLNKLSGADFDRAYAKMMVSDHKSDIDEFTREAQTGSMSDVKNFAQRTLPTLQEHAKLAQEMQQSVGK